MERIHPERRLRVANAAVGRRMKCFYGSEGFSAFCMPPSGQAALGSNAFNGGRASRADGLLLADLPNGHNSHTPTGSPRQPPACPPCPPPLTHPPMGRALLLTYALRSRERAHSDPQHWIITLLSMNIGAPPRRCRPFSLTERTVCSILEAPCLGKFRTGHGFFTCQWRTGSFLPIKNGRVHEFVTCQSQKLPWA